MHSTPTSFCLHSHSQSHLFNILRGFIGISVLHFSPSLQSLSQRPFCIFVFLRISHFSWNKHDGTENLFTSRILKLHVTLLFTRSTSRCVVRWCLHQTSPAKWENIYFYAFSWKIMISRNCKKSIARLVVFFSVFFFFFFWIFSFFPFCEILKFPHDVTSIWSDGD